MFNFFKKQPVQEKVSVQMPCKACACTGKQERPSSMQMDGFSSHEHRSNMMKISQGICIACNGLGFQIVEMFVNQTKKGETNGIQY